MAAVPQPTFLSLSNRKESATLWGSGPSMPISVPRRRREAIEFLERAARITVARAPGWQRVRCPILAASGTGAPAEPPSGRRKMPPTSRSLRGGHGLPHVIRSHTGLWGVLSGRWRRSTCLSPTSRSPAPLPPSADHAHSDDAEEKGRGLGDGNIRPEVCVIGKIASLPRLIASS